MHWFLAIVFLIFTLNNLSEAKYGKRLPSAVVVGTVYCDTCFRTDFSRTSHFISAALVEVECGVTSSKPSFRKETKTNERGEFKVRLPFSVSKHVKKIEGCSVKLIRSSEPYCSVASTATSDSLHLKSRKKGIHIFSAGFFTFKPLNEPALCSQKPSLRKSKEFNSKKSLVQLPVLSPIFPIPPQTQDPTPMPYQPPTSQNLLPPLPELPKLPPLPQLPPLPPLPGFPNFPKKETETSEKSKSTSDPLTTLEVPLLPSPQPGFGFRFPPNPFRPPSFLPRSPFRPPSFFPRSPFRSPSFFPRSPFLSSPLSIPPNPVLRPPPSIFPRNPFQPSPPVVGLTPSLAPPPAPVGLPPFPFQPAPGFPGIPPVRN
ncbi:leucine-rich repeat extensin-like protein 3 isoform X1 [Rhododendron vialii]|uniref:leucine-rich repeat extensin-like protein 3 isoform X1 n=1 Tax=Rhododendron vialii TaxID=182163 RepID=UPI00265DAB2D|nr:leucine-rich repeat extensin-like protein 3 isoform X1 [Rhododendron vialii]